MRHFVMTLEEHRAAIGGRYVDPARYGARMGSDPTSGRPEMICRTGDGHAEGVRDWSRVTCPQCLARRPFPRIVHRARSIYWEVKPGVFQATGSENEPPHGTSGYVSLAALTGLKGDPAPEGWNERAADIVRLMDDQQVRRAAEDIDTAAMIARGLTGQTITEPLAEAVRDTCRGLTLKGA